MGNVEGGKPWRKPEGLKIQPVVQGRNKGQGQAASRTVPCSSLERGLNGSSDLKSSGDMEEGE